MPGFWSDEYVGDKGGGGGSGAHHVCSREEERACCFWLRLARGEACSAAVQDRVK